MSTSITLQNGMQTLLTFGDSTIGYHYCYCNKRNGKLTYDRHEGGAKSRWMVAIREVNTGDQNPTYASPAGDCFPVRKCKVRP